MHMTNAHFRLNCPSCMQFPSICMIKINQYELLKSLLGMTNRILLNKSNLGVYNIVRTFPDVTKWAKLYSRMQCAHFTTFDNSYYESKPIGNLVTARCPSQFSTDGNTFWEMTSSLNHRPIENASFGRLSKPAGD